MLSLLTRTPPKPVATKSYPNLDGLERYREVAEKIGMPSMPGRSSTLVEVLTKLDYPVYDLKEVTAYMDVKSKKDGADLGWVWRPVRARDRIINYDHGVRAVVMGSKLHRRASGCFGGSRTPGGDSVLYPHRIPLHAIERIAAIEEAVGGNKSDYNRSTTYRFHVTDYAMQDDAIHPNPDPFLCVIDTNVSLPEGLFIIDFWDEPGFGLEQMLK